MRDIVIIPLDIVAFTVHGWPKDKRLCVRRRGPRGGLLFEDSGAIASIAMDMGPDAVRAKLRPVMRDIRLMVTDTHIMPATGQARLYTPESEAKTCVYLDVLSDGFRLVGGLSIIEAIHGTGLEAKIDERR